MPPQFKRAASTQEQAEQKNQEERNKQLYEQAEAGDLDEVDGLLKKGGRPLRASAPRPARLGPAQGPRAVCAAAARLGPAQGPRAVCAAAACLKRRRCPLLAQGQSPTRTGATTASRRSLSRL